MKDTRGQLALDFLQRLSSKRRLSDVAVADRDEARPVMSSTRVDSLLSASANGDEAVVRAHLAAHPADVHVAKQDGATV